jgi:hypothetical protein
MPRSKWLYISVCIANLLVVRYRWRYFAQPSPEQHSTTPKSGLRRKVSCPFPSHLQGYRHLFLRARTCLQRRLTNLVSTSNEPIKRTKCVGDNMTIAITKSALFSDLSNNIPRNSCLFGQLPESVPWWYWPIFALFHEIQRRSLMPNTVSTTQDQNI